MKKLRVGIIGLGGVSTWGHLPAYKQIERIEVVAASEIALDRLNQICDQYGIAQRYLDYEEMLRKESLDIVSVLTPPFLHRTMCEKVAEAGVNVLCEKPLATSVKDAEAVIAACNKNKVKLMYSENYRFMPACERAKKWLEDGTVGRVIFVNELNHGLGGALARLMQEKQEGKLRWRQIRKFSGGGILLDHGIHAIDVCRWFVGSEVESVYGKIRSFSGIDVEDFAQLIMNFRNGSQGYVENSWTCKAGGHGDLEIMVYGEEASLRTNPRTNTMFIFKDKMWEPVRLPDVDATNYMQIHSVKGVMESFAESCLDNKPSAIPGTEGLRDLEVVLAAYESGKRSTEWLIQSHQAKMR